MFDYDDSNIANGYGKHEWTTFEVRFKGCILSLRTCIYYSSNVVSFLFKLHSCLSLIHCQTNIYKKKFRSRINDGLETFSQTASQSPNVCIRQACFSLSVSVFVSFAFKCTECCRIHIANITEKSTLSILCAVHSHTLSFRFSICFFFHIA